MPLPLSDPSLLRRQCLIDGDWRDAQGGATFPVDNPASGETLARVADGGALEAGAAIAAARAALPGWRALTARERARLLRRWYELVLANQEDLARLMTLEQGKPLTEARGEIAYGAAYIDWFAEEARRVYGDIIPTTAPDRRLLVTRQPVGVVAAITPWNFPMAMLARKLAPALAVGCTVVAKPAAETPLSALALAELAQRAGMPPGVLNLVVGTDAPAIGGVLTASRDVAKLSFTGSTAVGRQLLAACANTVKRVSMELGGNAPLLVFDDADLDLAVDGAMAAKFRNAGQTCICANRILVQRGIHDHFVARLRERIAALRVGDGLAEGTLIGPLINQRAVAKVADLVGDALAGGARLLESGTAPAGPGFFHAPTLLTGVSPGMRIFREEIFGPVAAITPFSDEAQAIALANDTDAGLAAYFYTADLGRMWRVSEGLDYGMVGVNETAISSEVIPFGGMKASGMGREGSRHGVDDYLEIKHICLGIGPSPDN